MPDTIIIKYSCSPFYEKMLKMLEHEIHKEIRNAVIEKEEIDTFLGVFEVGVKKNNKIKMVHSKLNTGKGITDQNVKDVVNKLKK